MKHNRNGRRAIEALRQFMDANALSQEQACKKLGVTQGHLSKVLTGVQPLSPKMRNRILKDCLLENATKRSHFETTVVEALRNSQSFRTLVTAALRMLNGLRRRD